ncbi:MAG: TatD family hydrolase [Bacilli bacterium]
MIDTHCHLFKEYYDNIDIIIKKMESNIMIVSGTDNESNLEVIDICNKYPNVYGTIGLHPTEIYKINEKSYKIIEDNINNPKIVGIGEIGLDYYWNSNDKEKQKEIFIKQILLAKKYNKAIVVHSREAINDTYTILKQYAKDIKIDVHCFSGSLEMAQSLIKIGARLGIGGVLTFKNNSKLINIVKNIDLNNLLLETDSPFLSPEPLRGKQNQPYNIIYVAQKIAEIKNINLEEVLKITTINAISQFDLNIDL